MDTNTQLLIFQAQVKNIKELESTWTHLKRSIHSDLVSNNIVSAKMHTKVLALVYCALSEAMFSKLIHTPNGFALDEIAQIKTNQQTSIVNAWIKCIELASAKVGSTKGNYIPNVRQNILRLVSRYIEEPSLIRNKIAHGQWAIALNRDNTNVNLELTNEINLIDIVKLDVLKYALRGLSDIVEAMIESPDRAFHRDYWPILTDVEQHLVKSSKYTLKDKVTLMKAKRARHNP